MAKNGFDLVPGSEHILEALRQHKEFVQQLQGEVALKEARFRSLRDLNSDLTRSYRRARRRINIMGAVSVVAIWSVACVPEWIGQNRDAVAYVSIAVCVFLLCVWGKSDRPQQPCAKGKL